MKLSLLALVAMLALGCATRPADAPEEAAGQTPDGPRITHGPILGRVTSESIGIWARTSQPATVTVFYGKRASAVDTSKTFQTKAENDNTGWINIESLDSGEKYYYEISTRNAPRGVEKLSGHFHTLPALQDVVSPDSNPDGLYNLRFEFACGNNQNPDAGSAFHEKLPTFATMRRNLVRDEQKSLVDFAILNGDWLYENDDKRRELPADWAAQNGVDEGRIPRPLQIMPNLAGVWANYKHYLEQGVPLADWHRYVPSYFTFDDHEIVNDVYGSGRGGSR